MSKLYEPKKHREVEEIMNEIPHWITRWGISSLIIISTIVFWVFNHISYPETIESVGIVTMDNQTQELKLMSTLPQSYYTDISINTKVLLHFKAYPDNEYGVVTTHIQLVGLKEGLNSQLSAEIALSPKVRTSKGVDIHLETGMMADCTFILLESTLLEKFIKNIKI